MSTKRRAAEMVALKLRVEARLARSVPDAIWGEVELDSKEMVLDGASGAFTGLLDEVRKLCRVAEGRPRGRRRVPQRTYNQPALPQLEATRARVLATRLAKLAREDAEVLAFREEFYPGKALTPTEARRFLSSPLHGLRSGAAFLAAGIPTARVNSWVRSERLSQVRLPDETTAAVTTYDLQCVWEPGGNAFHSVSVPRVAFADLQPLLTFSGDVLGEGIGDNQLTFSYLPGSVHAELVRLAHQLRDRLGIPAPDALLFVLTDKFPPGGAIHTQVDRFTVRSEQRETEVDQARITLEVDAWVPANTVRAFFQHARTWALGARYRAVGQNALVTLARTESIREAHPDLTWAEVAKRIGVTAGGRAVRQVCERTKRGVFRPSFSFGTSGKGAVRAPDRATWRTPRPKG